MFSYRLLILLLTPALLLYFPVLSLRLKQKRFLLQRLGYGLNSLPQDALWIHCASVGEVMTVLPLLDELFRRRPEQKIIVTTNTPTGAKIVQQQRQPNLFHCYLPFDWNHAVSRFIRKLRPRALLVMETEIWPNLFYQCHKNNCPLSIINARLSIKTTAANRWVKSVLKTALQWVDQIYARAEMDRTAYLSLGASEHRLQVLGNLKYSQQRVAGNTVQTKINRDYVLLASSHEDEERRIAEIWLASARPELLFIAPRHPQRCPGIIRQLKQLKPDLVIAGHDDAVTADTDIYILDTVGELMQYFPTAKLVMMGGSFVNVGGHNILEPAQFGRAIVCGPHMENFRDEAAYLLEKGALLQYHSLDELSEKQSPLLDDAGRLRQLEQQADRLGRNFDHIITDYADITEQLLDNDNPVNRAAKQP